MAKHTDRRKWNGSKPRRNAKEIAVDKHVGARLRALRLAREMSQEALARALGMTFQQLQKNENGKNRVGCSRLWRLCAVLQVKPNDFFDGLEYGQVETVEDIDAPTLRLAHRITKLSPGKRAALTGIVRAVAPKS